MYERYTCIWDSQLFKDQYFIVKAFYVLKNGIIEGNTTLNEKHIQFVGMHPVTVWHSDVLQRQRPRHNLPKYPG